MFEPNEFFDLEMFVHRGVFTPRGPVWSALANLTEYLRIQLETAEYAPNHIHKVSERAILVDEDYGTIHIGKNVTIEEGVRIRGPVIIGDNVHIGHGVLLREGNIIGDNVHIGHAVEVKHSVLFPGADIAHLNYVGDSVIGNNALLAGGAICANLRLDEKNVMVKHGEHSIDTGLPKFSGIVGDGTKVGANAVLNPGTLIGKNSVVFPLTSASGYHPAKSRIK